MWNLVGNQEDQFSHNAAHIIQSHRTQSIQCDLMVRAHPVDEIQMLDQVTFEIIHSLYTFFS